MSDGVGKLFKAVYGPIRNVTHANVMNDDERRRQELYDDFARTRKSKAVKKPKQETRECPTSERSKTTET